jgi:hypothetical protein
MSKVGSERKLCEQLSIASWVQRLKKQQMAPDPVLIHKCKAEINKEIQFIKWY